MEDVYLFMLGGFVTSIWLIAVAFLIYGAYQDGNPNFSASPSVEEEPSLFPEDQFAQEKYPERKFGESLSA